MRQVIKQILAYRIVLYTGLITGFVSGILISVPIDASGNTIATSAIRPLQSFGDLLPGVYTQKEKPVMKLSAWVPEWDYANGMRSFLDHADKFSQINPVWYHIDENGNLQSTSYVGNKAIAKYAKRDKVLLVPTIQSFDADNLHQAIGSFNRAQNHAHAIIKIVDQYKLDGIDLNYEMTYLDDKDNYYVFLETLSDALHARGKTLVIDVLSKTHDNYEEYDALSETRQVQDWSILATYADEIRIMAYDYNNSNPNGSPINPYYWLEEIAAYAITKAHPQKFVLGSPLYSYAWRNGELLGSHTYDRIQEGITKRDAKPEFDDQAKEWRVFLFGDKDTATATTSAVLGETSTIPTSTAGAQIVWYQDVESFKHRVELVKQYNFAGLALWRLGGEDTRIYDVVE